MDLLDALADPDALPRGPRTRWERARAVAEPFVAAVFAGFGAHTVGEAFYAGYQAAVERSVGTRGPQALLVNEVGRRAPREVQTTLEGGRVTGTKAFALLDAEQYWVLASRGRVGERLDLVLARVGASAVTLLPGQPAGWLPDVPHAAVTLDGVEVAELREDAWNAVVRPFRTVEDTAVLAAVVAARLAAASEVIETEAWLASLLGLAAAWRLDPRSAGAVRALAGIRAELAPKLAESPRGPLAGSWSRDRRLLDIAAGPRAARLERAREMGMSDLLAGADGERRGPAI